jgi:HEAT repeat protein
MTETRTFREVGQGGPSRPPLGEELLPPVEQPSARFIVQLFVVPALIVMAIVGVWLSFSWLVRSTTIGPEKLIEGVESGPSVARWQRASELADMLHNKRYASVKRDRDAASHLARVLDREIDNSKDGNDSQESATLRYFLARALGEFEVSEGTETLLRAAETKRTPDDELVRHGALEALATRAYDLGQLDPPEHLENTEAEPALIRLSGDTEGTIRSSAAYALGQMGTPEAIKRLEALVNDPDTDTRYNAAIALAHRGNTKSAETLAEMLDVSELSKAERSGEDEKGNFKAAVVVASALDASHALARQNPDADLSVVTKAVEQFSKTDPHQLEAANIPSRLVSDADHLLHLLQSK